METHSNKAQASFRFKCLKVQNCEEVCTLLGTMQTCQALKRAVWSLGEGAGPLFTAYPA